MTRVRTIDIHIGWLTILAALIAAAGILIWASTNQAPPDHPNPPPETSTGQLSSTPWPQVTRTIDGTITTPMPEDLDR